MSKSITMKNLLSILLFVFLLISCGGEDTSCNDIAGLWSFKMESTLSPQSLPRRGNMLFECDKTGTFTNAGSLNATFDWEFGNGGKQITIIRANWGIPEQGTTTYDVDKIDVNNFILTRGSTFNTLIRIE